MSELTRLIDEATRLLTLYEEHKDSQIEWKRRKAHVDLDRFLMEHREVAAILMVQGLQDAFNEVCRKEKPRVRGYSRMLGGVRHANS